MPILVPDVDTLMSLASLKLLLFNIIIDLTILNGIFLQRDTIEKETSFIADFYIKRMSHPPHKNKRFLFSNQNTKNYLLIEDSSLDFYLGSEFNYHLL